MFMRVRFYFVFVRFCGINWRLSHKKTTQNSMFGVEVRSNDVSNTIIHSIYQQVGDSNSRPKLQNESLEIQHYFIEQNLLKIS